MLHSSDIGRPRLHSHSPGIFIIKTGLFPLSFTSTYLHKVVIFYSSHYLSAHSDLPTTGTIAVIVVIIAFMLINELMNKLWLSQGTFSKQLLDIGQSS